MEIFDALEAVHAKSLVIVMVPFFAAAVGALTIDRRAPFRRALVFATHFFAFALLWLSVLFPLTALALRLIAKSALLAVGPHNLDLIFTGLEAAGLAWYLYVALDTVFGSSRLRRSITVVALIAGALCNPQGVPHRRLRRDAVFDVTAPRHPAASPRLTSPRPSLPIRIARRRGSSRCPL